MTDIHVAKDRKDVIVTAMIHRDAADYLVDDTRFWVVRPRVSAAGITGLGTLVSGAYISVDVGKSVSPQTKHFVGLEVPPIVTADLPGRQFVLHAEDLGSLSIGSLVFYRHIDAGQVVGYTLDPGGNGVTIKIFVNAPFDAYRHRRDALLAGERHRHVAEFRWSQAAHRIADLHPAGRRHLQSAAGQRRDAGGRRHDHSPCIRTKTVRCARRETEVRTFVMYFKGSLRGLSAGAPVELHGIGVGEVKSVDVEYDPDAASLRFPVVVDLYPAAHSRPQSAQCTRLTAGCRWAPKRSAAH